MIAFTGLYDRFVRSYDRVAYRLDRGYDRLQRLYHRLDGGYDRLQAYYDRINRGYDRLRGYMIGLRYGYDRLPLTGRICSSPLYITSPATTVITTFASTISSLFHLE